MNLENTAKNKYNTHGQSLEIAIPKRNEYNVCLGCNQEFHDTQETVNSGEKFVVDEALYNTREV